MKLFRKWAKKLHAQNILYARKCQNYSVIWRWKGGGLGSKIRFLILTSCLSPDYLLFRMGSLALQVQTLQNWLLRIFEEEFCGQIWLLLGIIMGISPASSHTLSIGLILPLKIAFCPSCACFEGYFRAVHCVTQWPKIVLIFIWHPQGNTWCIFCQTFLSTCRWA